MNFVNPPYLLSKLTQRNFIWQILTDKPTIYLTFDDGPIPEITPFVLNTLKEFNAKATFFCVGDNVRKHSDIFNEIIKEGHKVGNHTFNHLNGWKTHSGNYIENINNCENYFKTDLFRPPYGKLKPSQVLKLRGKICYCIVVGIKLRL
jgi:peptidoglycan-N-acetylglucosamine deacetylase